jgi:hypothetical protein
MERLINFHLENPLKTYNKIKKYFKPLKAKVYIGKTWGSFAKILDIMCWDVCWKSKWGSPRHEFDPYFKIVLFNTWEFRITWSYINDSGENESMEYWEAALNYLYFNKTLHQAVEEATSWEHYNYNTGAWEKKKYNFLRKEYQTLIS